MASLITVRLNRGDSPNLGFRLQGGKDFGTPLVIQKVNGGSPAERAGLVAGDAVIKINNTDVFNLRHKDAQDVVVRAGGNFEVTIQRGGSTWKPSVVPTGSYSSPTPSINHISPVTRTSLAAAKGENIGAIGTGHNLAAKPFSPQIQVNGSLNGTPKLVNKQYNTPMKLYSEESIAETLSAQTEVLSTGALGVNFKKNEKNYDASNSAVLRMLKESENEPTSHDEVIRSDFYSTHSHAVGGQRPASRQTRPAPQTQSSPQTTYPQEGGTVCTDCERVIVGVFVRIKDKNLHVECFKCSTCGTSLKNVGYYNINNKLYCDIHAKAAAIKNNPNPNLVPVAVQPGGKIPAHAISSALSSHSLPSPSQLSPRANNNIAPSYQATESNENVDVVPPLTDLPKSNITEANTNGNNKLYGSPAPVPFGKFLNKASNISGPRPFSSVSSPSAPKAAPLSPVAPPAPTFNNNYSTPAYSPVSSTGRFPSSVKPSGGLFKACPLENVVWPPPHDSPELPTACPLFYPPPSQIEAQINSKKAAELEIEAIIGDCPQPTEFDDMPQFYSPKPMEYSSGGRRSATECRETISGYLETQRLVENIVSTSATPTEIHIPYTEPPKPQKTAPEPSCPMDLPDATCCRKAEACELKQAAVPSVPSRRDNCVPLKWESPLTQAIRTTAPDADTFSQIPPKYSGSALASALAVAPSAPFTPVGTHCEAVPLPEETVPYFPPERPARTEEEDFHPPEKPKSRLGSTPEAPSETSTPPLRRKKKKDPADAYFEDLPKPQEMLSMRTALTTAPERPYSPLFVESTGATKSETRSDAGIDKSQLQRPTKPEVLPTSFQMNKKEPKPPSYYSPVVLEQRTEETSSEEHIQQSDTSKTTTIQRETVQNPQVQVVEQERVVQNFPPLFQGFSCSFQNKTEHSQFSVEVTTTPPVLSPPPAQVIKSVENLPGYIQKETITEEQREHSRTSKKQEQIREEVKTEQRAKQAEEVVVKKPAQPVHLHKAEYLPQYQVDISAEAEAELVRMEKMQKAQIRLEQQKLNQEQMKVTQQLQAPRPVVQQPIIKIESEVEPSGSFKPVAEERPPSRTFSPRPGATTPSFINKPPPVIPYYQANLVPQHMSAPAVHVFDPKTPDVSRSPSPCPGARQRSPSPGIQARSNVRAVSPASNPNPPLEKPQQPTQMYQSSVQTHSYSTPAEQQCSMVQRSVDQQCGLVDKQEQSYAAEKFDVSEARKAQKYMSQSGNTMTSTAVEEQRKQARLEQLKKSQIESLERSVDGRTQIQRKKIVTEEYERSQKETNIQIEKNVTTTRRLPFHDVNAPSIDRDAAKGHATDPRPLTLPFPRPSGSIPSTGYQQQVLNAPASRAAAAAATKPVFAPSSSAPYKHVDSPEHANELCHARENENLVELDEIGLEFPKHPPPPPPVPVYTQINISIPYQSVSPQLDSKGSSPRSDYSSYSSSSGKTGPHGDSARDKVLSDIRTLTPKLKKVSVSDTQSPRLNYIVNNAAVAVSNGGVNRNKKVTSELHIPIRDFRSSIHISAENLSLPDNLTYSNPTAEEKKSRCVNRIFIKPEAADELKNNPSDVPVCCKCDSEIPRGPFITALGKIWCPNHFICATPSCRRPLQDMGFVEERGQLYCEYCFEQYLAPPCSKCNGKIKGDCLKAIGKNFHPECFNCTYCGKLFGNSPFFLEDGSPYCEADWNELFTTKCFACGFPVEAGDRWVEALNNNYHSQCFNCTMCKKNLEGQSFFAKGGRPFCKNHAR